MECTPINHKQYNNSNISLLPDRLLELSNTLFISTFCNNRIMNKKLHKVTVLPFNDIISAPALMSAAIIPNKNSRQKRIATPNAVQQELNDLKKIVDSSLDVICTINDEGRFVTVSAASERVWGYKPNELTGKKCIDFVFENDKEITLKTNTEIISGKPVTMFENRYVHKNGSIVTVLWSCRWDDKDKLSYCVAKDATERKRLENAFEIERQRFRDLFLEAPFCMSIIKGPDHVYEMANSSYLQLINKKNIIGKPVREVVPEAIAQGSIELLDQVYKTGNIYAANERLLKLDKNGDGKLSDTYLNLINQPFTNQEGKIEGIFIFAVDVTEQVLSRKKIEESEKRFREIIETAQEGIWMIDEHNKTSFVNPKMCEMLGYTEVEMMGQDIKNFMDEEERMISKDRIKNRKKGINETRDSKFITKSGKYLWTCMSANSFFDPAGKYKGALAMITDITGRKMAEEKLQEKQEQLLASQKMAHIGSWHRNIINTGDIQSNPIVCSEETLRIMGLPPDLENMSYEKFIAIIHPEDLEVVKEESQKIFNKISCYYKIDHRIILPDGTIKWVSRDAKLIEDEVTGQPVKIIGTIQDITESKEHELQIRKNSREREILITQLTNSIKDLKQFTFITSHNFKSPLSNLTALLDLIDYSTLTSDNKEIIEMFRGSTAHLNKTINDLIRILIIKNNVNATLVNNDINEILDEVCISLQQEINQTGCTIKRRLKVENIHFNKLYLHGILTNLLSNALKFRSPNRTLQVDISTEQKPNGEVLMTIKDNGIGIDLKRHRDKIFGLYQRFHSNTDGVGLGLFMVKSQITTLGGDITVESKVDKGTSFKIIFRENLLQL